MAHIENVIQFGAHVTFRTTPAGWKLHPDGSLEAQRMSKGSKHLDAWETRRRFLSLRFDQTRPEPLLEFLNDAGLFAGRTGNPHPVDIEAAEEWQRLLGKLLVAPFEKWMKVLCNYSQYKEPELLMSDRFVVEFKFGSGVPLAVVRGTTVLEAILATIHIDHAREAKFGICARKDCRQEFEITSAHTRRYCDQYCAHLESVRRMRTRRRKVGNLKKAG